MEKRIKGEPLVKSDLPVNVLHGLSDGPGNSLTPEASAKRDAKDLSERFRDEIANRISELSN